MFLGRRGGLAFVVLNVVVLPYVLWAYKATRLWLFVGGAAFAAAGPFGGIDTFLQNF